MTIRRLVCSRRLVAVYSVTLALLCLLVELDGVAAKAQPRHKRRRKSMHGQTMTSYFSFLKYLYAIILVPLVGFLLYALLRDPVTPHILKELWYRLQEMVTGQKIVLDDAGVEGGAASAADVRTARSLPPSSRRHEHEA